MVWQQVMLHFLVRIKMTEIQIVEKLVDTLKLKIQKIIGKKKMVSTLLSENKVCSSDYEISF
jgi:predicted RNA-binding protein